MGAQCNNQLADDLEPCFEVVEVPEWVQFGDFDGDGLTDLLADFPSGEPWGVLPGLGGGAFGEARRLEGAGLVKVADLDGDGFDDVISFRITSLSIWYGGAAGLMRESSEVYATDDLTDFTVGDFTTAPGLEITSWNFAFPGVDADCFERGAMGTYELAREQWFDGDPEGLQLGADFDGDGFDDVTQGGLGDAAIYFTTPDGFTDMLRGADTAMDPVMSSEWSPLDLDGDGRSEHLGAGLTSVHVRSSEDRGPLTLRARWPLPTSDYWWGTAALDLDQDGSLEVVAVGWEGTDDGAPLVLYTFDDFALGSQDPATVRRLHLATAPPGAFHGVGVVVPASLDADPWPDLLVVTSVGYFGLLSRP
jgi:hypothetical protein